MKDYPYGVTDPSGILEIADRILDEFFQITKQLKIRACLAFGLCLGFVRDGKYIVGDNDLDVVVIAPTLDKVLVDCLKAHGFGMGASHSLPAGNTHFYKDRILLDIYFRQSGEFYSKFDEVRYKGKLYPVPHPVEKYLSKCYTNWKVKEDQATLYHD